MSAPATAPAARRIVILGDGVAAWMTAAALADALGPSCRIFVVDPGSGPPADFAGADTLLPLAAARLPFRRDEDRLLSSARGTFGWGVAFAGWAAPDRAWFLPFGSIGANLGPLPFHHIVLRLRSEGRTPRLADYSLPALAAQAGRFARPVTDARSVLSTCAYALHLDLASLAAALRARAEGAGVEQAPAPFGSAERTGAVVAAVRTADGTRLAADLFLDLSAGARLAGDGEWEDWSAWLPCDRALVARVPRPAPPPPYGLAEAHAAGWTRQLPLADATAVVSCYRADAGGEAAALASLRRAAGSASFEPDADVPLAFGRRREAWRGNCVALGPAATLVDPLVVSNLHLLQTALARLLELLPAEAQSPATAREYNRRTAAELDNVRDHAAALYLTNGRRGEPFWDECSTRKPPASLDYRMRLFTGRGKVVLYDEEPLEEAAWTSLFDEQGIRPARWHPMVDGLPAVELDAHLARVRAIMIEELKRMPFHADYLARLGAAGEQRAGASREVTR